MCTCAVRLDSGVDYIQSVIGDMGLSYQTMADTLRHFDYDAEAALGYLLDNGASVSVCSREHLAVVVYYLARR